LTRSSKVLSTLVENKPGTLFRVIHLVRLMRLNIEGLTLGVTNGGAIDLASFYAGNLISGVVTATE